MIGIYKITNPIGQVYIGKSIDIHKRFLSHRVGSKSQPKLKMSFDEFGFDNHKFDIIYICGESVLGVFESFFIDKYNSQIIGLNSANVVSDYSHLEFEPIEICEPYYVKNMIEDESRNAGRKPKFKVPSKKVLIPSCIEDKVNALAEEYRFINHLQTQSLKKCADEVLKQK